MMRLFPLYKNRTRWLVCRLFRSPSIEDWFDLHFYGVTGQYRHLQTGSKPDINSLAKITLDTESRIFHSPLWEDYSGGGEDGSSSWHSPEAVCGLAFLWHAVPELRADIPLERILDYWVEAIARSPLPGHSHGKGGYGPSDDMMILGFAAAALHMGEMAFEKPEYGAAKETLFQQMRNSSESRQSIYAKMLAGEGLDENEYWSINTRQKVCGFVSIYGQTCAFLGKKEEAEAAKVWIRAALLRTAPGNGSKPPFSNYQSSNFEDRCGLLAAFRGKSSFLVPVPGHPIQSTEAK